MSDVCVTDDGRATFVHRVDRRPCDCRCSTPPHVFYRDTVSIICDVVGVHIYVDVKLRC